MAGGGEGAAASDAGDRVPKPPVLSGAAVRGKFISYLRVSTDKQGARGYGLDAQRKAVMDYLNGGNWELVAEFVEVESGKRNDRPQLAAALAACKKHKAKLVIAKLDRLARNVAFIANPITNAGRRVRAARHGGEDEHAGEQKISGQWVGSAVRTNGPPFAGSEVRQGTERRRDGGTKGRRHEGRDEGRDNPISDCEWRMANLEW